ncbi:MAG: site-2 protease family protein [Thermoplasmata archaeon]
MIDVLRRETLPREIYIARPPRGLKFSAIELQQITISILVLALAFTILFSDPLSRTTSLDYFARIFAISLAAVVTGFLFHELAHKVLAQKYGCWAEYRMSPFGLLFALMTAMFGFVFAAPGAVHISGHITKEQSGKISIAGPLTNVAVGGPFLALAFLFAFTASDWAQIPWFIAFINLLLAGFNMIPFPPFDGSKVVYWSKAYYVLALVLIGSLFAMVWFFGEVLILLGL